MARNTELYENIKEELLPEDEKKRRKAAYDQLVQVNDDSGDFATQLRDKLLKHMGRVMPKDKTKTN